MAETAAPADSHHTAGLLVIADDFTGANDTGVALVAQGMAVCVQLDVTDSAAEARAGRALIYSTDSRAMSATDAAQKVTQAVQAGLPVPGGKGWVFKKIDSTLRGNLGAETEAALMALDCPLAIIAPAVPQLGRVIKDGLCYVNDRLLTETEFATDPKTPVSTASVGGRLAEQTALRQHHVSLEVLRSADFQAQLFALAASGVRIVVADCQTPEDLNLIIRAAESLPFRPLLVGASGLSHALAQHCLAPQILPRQTATRTTAPLLAVVGSMSEIAAQQIAFVQQRRPVSLVDIDVLRLFSADSGELLAALSAEIRHAVGEGKHCFIRTRQSEEQRHSVALFCQQKNISRLQMGERIAAFLGQLIQHVLQQPETKPGGLYLSGGDIALAVARALGAKEFEIKGQIAGCVPWGFLPDSPFHRLPVMTKAGGFGTENTLLEVLRFIEEKLSD
ncbi:serine kinase [Rahnella sp. AA]|uniref:D-threonate kinase n=1 Tax=Rahnella sp. AA TaxID=2057180 RepID=UPI000C323D77|nr:four-carbon acid sugar kinase family protein [Rahnella sp. AA]PKE32714.1 serine kinase [Rahnella sp. AA]